MANKITIAGTQLEPKDNFYAISEGPSGVFWFDGTAVGSYDWSIADPLTGIRSGGIELEGGPDCTVLLTQRYHWHGDLGIYKLRLRPKIYYPRLARPFATLGWKSTGRFSSDNYPQMPESASVADSEMRNEIFASMNQMRWLADELSKILLVVHPDKANFDTFGTSIRNLLIVAATECEAQWRGILKANGYVKDRLTTNDYFKLHDVMKLADFKASFTQYPWLDEFMPFYNWSSINPTASLKWYNSYNITKHDREGGFSKASLRMCLDAVASVWIMLDAQFGPASISSIADISSFMKITQRPVWNYYDMYTDYETSLILPDQEPCFINYPF